MRAALLLTSALSIFSVACSGGSNDPTDRDSDNCPWRDSAYGSSSCTSGDDDTPFYCTCNPGDSSCGFSGFEYDCCCACVDTPSGRWWSCFQDTDNPPNACPQGAPPGDAGVD